MGSKKNGNDNPPKKKSGSHPLLTSPGDQIGRQLAGEALGTSESFLHGILDQSPYPMWIGDGQGTLIWLNQACRDLLHLTAAEVVGKYNVFQDNVVEQQGVLPLVRRVFEKGETVRFELTYDTSLLQNLPLKTATSVILDVTVSPVIDGDGRITNAVFQHVDITERKRAEEALKKEKLFTEAILDSLPGTFFLLDAQGKHLRTNTSGLVASGYSLEEMSQLHALDFIAEEDKPAAQRALAEVFENGKTSIEVQHLSKNGRKTPFLFSAKKFLIDGTPYIIGSGLDISARKQAEEALRESEKKYRSLYQEFQGVLNAIPDILCLLSPDLKIVWGNEATAIQVGQSGITEIIGKHCYPLRHERSEPCENCPVLRCFGSGKIETEEVVSFGVLWELRAVPVYDDQGELVGAVEVARNITARKRIEKALQESEEQLRLALQAANQGFYDLNIQTGESRVSPEYATMLGYDPGEFHETKAHWIERLHPDDREQVAATYQAYIREDIPDFAVEFRQRTRSGDWKWILSLGKIVAWDEDGKPLRMLGTLTDITERKKTEEALRNSERRLSEIIDFLPDATFAIDLTGKIITWNRAIEEMTGVKAEDMMGKGDYEYTVPFYGKRRPALIDLVFMPDAEIEKKYVFVKKEGDILLAEAEVYLKEETQVVWAKARPLYDSEGNVVGAIEAIRDITERKRAEEERARLEAQMREVQKLESLGVLAGGIAHDFNNLLMAILGNADLALLSLSLASPARPFVEEISRGSLRAADLCRQMLAYSGKGRFVIGRYDLAEIVQEMAQMLKVSVSKKGSLRYSFAPDLPAVEVDATQMRQIIMNLIINASEALEDQNGFISVATGVMDCDRAYLAESYLDDNLPEGRYVYLEVADTGCGMDDDTRRRIFDPFFTTKFTGRGLGLAAVLGIVRGHQGAIKVYSEPGQGTSFKALFPAVDWAPGERTAGVTPGSRPLPGGTILLVDDDSHVRKVVSQMLERLGFNVLTATHGREGLEVFKANGGQIDCVILDLTMPEMAGDEVFRELRRLRKNVRVILSSGFNEQDVTQRFAGKGFAGFIQKPYTVSTLRETLNEVLVTK